MKNMHNNSTSRWITIIVMAVSLTFATVTGGFAISLSSRVKENEKAIGVLDVILEKINNIEYHIEEIKEEIREDKDD